METERAKDWMKKKKSERKKKGFKRKRKERGGKGTVGKGNHEEFERDHAKAKAKAKSKANANRSYEGEPTTRLDFSTVTLLSFPTSKNGRGERNQIRERENSRVESAGLGSTAKEKRRREPSFFCFTRGTHPKFFWMTTYLYI